jgi:transposase-like protein
MKTAGRKTRTARHRYTAAEKCQAVLALWTERSSGAELCQQLGVTWNQLSQWQDQAMAGMLQALEPKRGVPCGNLPLSVRLQGLLTRKAARAAVEESLPSVPSPKLPRPVRRPPVPEAAAENPPA